MRSRDGKRFSSFLFVFCSTSVSCFDYREKSIKRCEIIQVLHLNLHSRFWIFIQFLVDTLNVCKQFLFGSDAWTHLPSHTCQVWTPLHCTGSEWLHRTIAWCQVATPYFMCHSSSCMGKWVCVWERSGHSYSVEHIFTFFFRLTLNCKVRVVRIVLLIYRTSITSICNSFLSTQFFFLNYFSQDSIELFKNGCPKETGNYSRYFICKKYFFHREMCGCWKSTREQRVPHAYFWGYVDQSRCSSMKLLIFFCLRFSFRSYFAETCFREHQRSFGPGNEIGQILFGLQSNIEIVAPGQSEIDHHCQQYATAQVRQRWILV